MSVDLNTVPRVRNDFVPADAYVSPDFVKLEKAKLWPKVWMIACREEELQRAGDYIAFEIADESLMLVRGEDDAIRAFFNVCQHRGRRLKHRESGNGGKKIYCPFHGWTYNLDGSINSIPSRADWQGCPDFADANLRLNEIRIEAWAGWLWVTMSDEVAPLLDYLGPLPERLALFEYEKCRIAWQYTLSISCNWKVVVDAFIEGYHSPSTHPKTFPFGYPGSTVETAGLHSAFYIGNYLTGGALLPDKEGAAAKPPRKVDVRERMRVSVMNLYENAHCMMTKYAARALERVMELPADTAEMTVLQKFDEFHREEFARDGVEWPVGVTPEVLGSAASDWHIFPNMVMVPTVDGVLWHRMRPNGDDPGKCFWDIWALDRVPAGTETPRPPREVFTHPDQFKGRNPFLEEDFSNMELVQQGMKSRGFRGARTNPKEELSVSNFHRNLYEYFDAG